MSGNRDNFLVLTSFLLSTSIYVACIVIILFFSYVNKNLDNAIKYTKDKDVYVDIYVMDIDDSLNILSTQKEVKETKEVEKVTKEKALEEETIKTTHKKVDDKPKEEKKEVVEKKVETIAEKPKDEPLSNLFEDIDKKKLEEEAKKEEDKIQSRKKSDKETKTIQTQSSSKQISKNKGDKSSGKSQNTGVYNKFKGEIESTLRNIWSTYRAMPNQDATVEITIDANGKATYNIIELSYNTEFNQKLRDFLSRIERITFSKPPDGQPYTHRYKMQDLLR